MRDRFTNRLPAFISYLTDDGHRIVSYFPHNSNQPTVTACLWIVPGTIHE